jgi:hypothetical protein
MSHGLPRPKLLTQVKTFGKHFGTGKNFEFAFKKFSAGQMNKLFI